MGFVKEHCCSFETKISYVTQKKCPLKFRIINAFSALLLLQEMKAMLYAAVEEAPSAELVEPEVLRRHFAHFDEHFFHYCDKELAKINTFYSGNYKYH